jgi:NAD(P)-dependent dehydrogenase (short-subunit alcohol dehydrogenase family)
MRVLHVGATGVIGKAVAEALGSRHEVVRVGNTRGDYQVDIASKDSIERLYQAVGSFDAVIATAGSARFGDIGKLSDDDFRSSLANKLMGQINLVRCGVAHIRDGGSFTLTSGLFGREPASGTAALSLVNAALEGFVRAAALDMPRGTRINVVAPPWVAETLAAMGRDPSRGMPAARVALAYVQSLEGTRNGAVFDARVFA